MVLKLVLTIAAIAILITLGTIAVKQSGRGTPSVQDKDSLVEIARRKKAEGQDKARVSGYIIDYGEDMNLDDILKKYSVLIAEPIESKSLAADSRDITTWYKFRILETLSPRSHPGPVPAVLKLPRYLKKWGNLTTMNFSLVSAAG